MASQGNFSGDNNYGVQLGVNRGSFTTNHYHVPVVKQKEDFSFHKPFGVCLGQAPRIDPELFIGRNSELNEMKEVLKPGDSSRGQRRLVLGGVGGIGKTQLAIIYAERHHNMYDSIFWLNASSEATLNNSFRSIAELVFDVQGPDVLEGRQALIHVHQWLSDTKNTRWLLIFDNFDNPNLFKIENYYPPGSHGALVITTRRPDLVAGIDIRIQPLQNVEESLAILQTRSKQENAKYDPYAKKLATRLDGLPLALATAGAYVQRRSFTFKGYLQEYEKQWKIDSRRLPQLPEYQDRTLYTTWDLSYADLEKNDPDAASFYELDLLETLQNGCMK
ncbi:hypothetical protein EYZ11_011501 [Aspergillus tanneri]|uniref:NB-ARC domain-containing protein n=1 Tax=Aspergillus tanneri TaxID=1220188 RepID=A0A4S3J398_9EURO|nr:hypothetical protein EYZ11_011501 [Aspergillus tanneri]